ncbi:MAG: hypothetical protein ACI4JM_12740, partial [Oscillospiraceae bacterium]
SAAQPFFIKRLPKNFFERIKRRGLRPHTPVSLIRATKGSAFGNRQLFEKSWAKTCGEPPLAFSLFYLLVTFFLWLDHFVLPVNNAEFNSAVEPVNKVIHETKPL